MDEQDNTNSDEEVSFEELNSDGEEKSGKDVVQNLRERLKKSEAESKEYLEGWQRAKADYVNAKRGEEEERVRAGARAKERIVSDILPVLDSFELAFANKTAWESVDKNWRVGVEYIHSQLVSVLEEHGVEQVGSIGEPFDPNLYQSVESVPVENPSDDGKVLEVLQRGYTIGGRVLRAARVKVGNYQK